MKYCYLASRSISHAGVKKMRAVNKILLLLMVSFLSLLLPASQYLSLYGSSRISNYQHQHNDGAWTPRNISLPQSTCPLTYDYHKRPVCNITIHVPAVRYSGNGTILLNSRHVLTFGFRINRDFLVVAHVSRLCEMTDTTFYHLNLTTYNNTKKKLESFLRRSPDSYGLVAGFYSGMIQNASVLSNMIQLKYDHYKHIKGPVFMPFIGRLEHPGHRKLTVVPRKSDSVKFNATWILGEPFRCNLTNATYKDILQQHPDHDPGGYWRPEDCTPIQKVAIIIPYRDRNLHLMLFLQNMLPFLKLQKIEFNIFIINQAGPEMFNRAALLNVGFVEAKKLKNFDCYIFHDVDIVPEDLTNYYMCGDQPKHMVVSRNYHRYREALVTAYFGGGMAMTAKQIEDINGFPNMFFGWGGEDDEIRLRILAYGMNITRNPEELSGYVGNQHKRDESNPMIGSKNMIYRPTRKAAQLNLQIKQKYMTIDGISTMKYTVINFEKFALYTNITVHIPGPTDRKDQINRMFRFRQDFNKNNTQSPVQQQTDEKGTRDTANATRDVKDLIRINAQPNGLGTSQSSKRSTGPGKKTSHTKSQLMTKTHRSQKLSQAKQTNSSKNRRKSNSQ